MVASATDSSRLQWVGCFRRRDWCRCSPHRRTSNCPYASPESIEGSIASRATETLALVGLEGRFAHTAAELSGGEQHRVALARAVAKRPMIVIADEPTAQLDSETAAGIINLLCTVANTGTAVLMATHDLAAVTSANRVMLMEDGRLTPSPATKEPSVERSV